MRGMENSDNQKRKIQKFGKPPKVSDIRNIKNF